MSLGNLHRTIMDSIRVKNLHCLADTGEIPLKPINILVGANSSGKSSFLRLFPLLKQGLNTNKKGPILWLSEDVDFGDFKTAVKKGEKNIELQFAFTSYTLTLNIIEEKDTDYINRINVIFCDQKIQIDINGSQIEKILINDETFTNLSIDVLDNKTRILPDFYSIIEKSNIFNTSETKEFLLSYDVEGGSRIAENINNILISYKKEGWEDNLILDFSKEKGKDKYTLSSLLKILKKSIQSPEHSSINSWKKDDKEFIEFNNRLILLIFPLIIRELNSKLSGYFRSINYIGPVRATAERYYRRQNLSLDFIDSRGINLPMFINDLAERDKKDLNSWMSENFGFHLVTDYSGGHITIFLVNGMNKEKINLADSGFGFSQIMPIIIILWITSKQMLRRKKFMLTHPDAYYYVIEQPELHLHPALQAKLTDVFISAIKLAKDNEIDLKLIIETHSETIINRIGRRISEMQINKEDVTVALFDNKLNKEGKNVTLSHFNEEGFLENWPIGFFDAD
ncbi:hypothetical protein EZS27_012812 [termite gut metagenome]|uniref:Endonuclease GajA/Old nuclease/RecF-like AAA domain-containing protein n=1 Tax=termite gut metagenome TaxID=433724 RepID=A0A5J4RZG1_9ZZZZ